MATTAPDPGSLAVARVLASGVGESGAELARLLPSRLAEPEAAHRVERALRDAADALRVAAAAAGLTRTGGGDAR